MLPGQSTRQSTHKCYDYYSKHHKKHKVSPANLDLALAEPIFFSIADGSQLVFGVEIRDRVVRRP
jgi:hypothetical protein